MKAVKFIASVLVILGIGAGGYYYYQQKNKPKAGQLKIVMPELRDITVSIQSTGMVEPENRVSILPPVAGRVDNILVDEGDVVTRGQKVAEMSSTNRAALIDLAKVRSPEDRRLLEQTYFPTSVFAPVSGQIIKRSVVAGQTVNQTMALFELSDRLVVRAEVDESDLSGVMVGMGAQITVDAFRDLSIDGKVIRIAHQSKVVNNINFYDVVVAMKNPWSTLRSGMTANVSFLKDSLIGVLTLPVWALQGGDGKTCPLTTESGEVVQVKLGASDGRYTQIEGLKPGQAVFIQESAVKGEGGASESNSKAKARMPRLHP